MFLRAALSRSYKLNPFTSLRSLTHTFPKAVPSRVTSEIPPVSQSADGLSPMKLSVLKRVTRKKRMLDATTTLNQQREEQFLNVSALATADWYDLEQLKQRFLSSSSAFQLVTISDAINDVLCIQIRSNAPTIPIGSSSSSEAFIFDDGAVVFWNVKQEDERTLLKQVTSNHCFSCLAASSTCLMR